jgi:drug/metabolite transporter (DMT)-like permease
VKGQPLSFDVMLAVLLGAAFHASWNALAKSGSDPFLDIVLIATGGAAVAAMALPLMPLPDPASWPCLISSTLIHVGYYALLVFAYRGGGLSLVYPIMRGSAPALTTLAAAVLLGERPSWGGWAGVLLVSGGVLLLAADSPRSKDFRLSPVLFALLNAAVIVGYTLVDGVGARLSGHAFSYTGWVIMLAGGLFFLVSIGFGQGRLIGHILRQWKKGTAGGVCALASYSLALWAMTHAPIALVTALRETSIIFSAILAVIFLRESISPLRYVSISIVSLGAIAIKSF